MTRRFLSLLLVLSCSLPSMGAQSAQASQLVAAMLTDTPLESDLQHLCDVIGGRETGSDANDAAVQWAFAQMKADSLDVQLEEFTMPSLWLESATTASVHERGEKIFSPLVVSKYHSPVGEHRSAVAFARKGAQEDFTDVDVKGKWVLVETEKCMDIAGLFAEYTQAYRVEELARASGAAGVIYMSSRPKKLLYRFTTSRGVQTQLPQIVMAREDAKRCIRLIESGASLELTVKISAEESDQFTSHNVIAEIPGTDLADEIILIGAHIDSWALGTGANDNGCNVALVMDIARQMMRLGIKPRRTIRFALWNGEEQGFFGSHTYTLDHADELDQHQMAMSIDIGSGKIIGFFTNGDERHYDQLDRYLAAVSALGPFLHIPNAIVGTDNLDFLLQGIPNLVANHKPYNYGLNYHASSDTYDKVDLQSLKLNSAIIAAVTLGYANEPNLATDRMTRAQLDKVIKDQSLEFSLRMFDLWNDWTAGKRGLK